MGHGIAWRPILILATIAGLAIAAALLVVPSLGEALLGGLRGAGRSETAPDLHSAREVDARLRELEKFAADTATPQPAPDTTAAAPTPPEPASAADRALLAALQDQALADIAARDARRQAALESPLGESLFTIESIRAARAQTKETEDAAPRTPLNAGLNLSNTGLSNTGLSNTGLSGVGLSDPPSDRPGPGREEAHTGATGAHNPGTGNAQNGETRTGDATSALPQEGLQLLAAGSVIPAALTEDIRSDLPGLIRAQTTDDVYDTPGGHHVLIPRGTLLLGAYAETARVGQHRLFVYWTRALFPDGTSVDLNRAGGLDATGASGLRGRRRSGFITAVLGTALMNLATQVGRPAQPDTTDSELTQAVRAATSEHTGSLAERYFGDTLAAGPRFAVKAGTVVNVQIARDYHLPGRQMR